MESLTHAALDNVRYEKAVEWFRRNAHGYWLNWRGSLTVTLYRPSRWERLKEWMLHGRSWRPYR